MQLLMIWPDTQQICHLDASSTAENATCFSVEQGTFGPHKPAVENNAVYFYNTACGLVILNDCEDYVCLVNDSEISRGQTHSLLFGASLQLGHFAFRVELDDETADYEAMLPGLLNVHSEKGKDDLIIPEVEDILPNGGHYTGDLRYFSDAEVASETEVDILRKLEVEYKKFLIWGEQNRDFFDEVPGGSNKLSDEDHYFDVIRDEMRTRTMTECIVHKPSLFDAVWKELNVMDSYDDLLPEDEKVDILKSLAPENISLREKKQVPELVFHDLYKTGLDSLY
ncbi:TagK domain-containing protein [Erwinia psidii]|uniref:TagK domain-containing protein n=2 Tax=Erwinia psidii TaxID=69224 RepID=A0A3N6SCA3_9GAMM|nr:TagK domain-containing protein [Erwinia psidii]MCX8966818.1 TagK domain-containing protein [Erwinia psidii]RQM39000.1 TagK domain-containing protein [Erwinia psidii]